MAVMLAISVVQIWVCGDFCRAGAIRIFPENGTRKTIESKVHDMENVQNYFNGTTASFSFKIFSKEEERK
ncbi:hypothetical protein GQ457_03G007310 [Hibiscus cannabinus]